jgi:hypothetical protein
MPDVQAVQSAYEGAKDDPDSDPSHVDDLRIRTARCQAIGPALAVACQIDFVTLKDPAGRLYAEIVTVEQRDGHWVLLSGLCKRRPAKR